MQRNIAGEEYYYPKVKDIICESLEPKQKGKVLLIVGQPGSGKSVFMSQLYDEFNKNEIEYLIAIRADYLRDDVSPSGIYELFDKVRIINKPKILLLDSLDVLAYSRRRELQEWLFYVDKLKKIEGMAIICTSRNFEAEHLYPMNEQEWSEKIHIDILPDEFIERVLIKLNYPVNSISLEFKKFLSTPLHLRIAFDIIQNNGDPKGIFNLHDLYAKLFELLKLTSKEVILLVEIAEHMISNKTIHLSSIYSFPLLENIIKIERPGITGIIQIDHLNQELSFSHQTLIDYFSAWGVIIENKSLFDFVLDHNQSLFIRPVIRHILGFLRLNLKDRLFKELKDIFLDRKSNKKVGFIKEDKNIRMHIKTAILSNMASWNNPNKEEAIFLKRLFSETEDKNTFVIHFFNSRPNPNWFDVLKDIYIFPIIKNRDDSDVEYRIILSFLSNIAKFRPSEILDISLLLLKQESKRTIEWFLINISEELTKIELDSSLKEKYVFMLEEAVRNNYICFYYEIGNICINIAKYFPERGLKLYFENIFKELHDNQKKIGYPQESLTYLFDKVMMTIYERYPFLVLSSNIEFLENIFSNSPKLKNTLLDSPMVLLYSKFDREYGLEALYHWYKLKILEFCLEFTNRTKQIISNLEQSKWETQKQLSMLCKLENISNYKKDIFAYIKDILKSDINNSALNRQSELFIRAIEKIFDVISFEEKEEIVEAVLKLNTEDKSQARIWIWKPLNHIPNDFRDDRLKDKMKSIQNKFGFEDYKYSPPMTFVGFRRVLSPVSSKELKEMGENELYEILIKNRDLKEKIDFENDKIHGGVEQLAEEVASVLGENLDKYKKIIMNLSKDSSNDRYLEWLFIIISQKGAPEKDIDWIIELIYLVYQRDNLQLEIIRLLRKIAENISNKHIEKIQKILIDMSDARDPEKDEFIKYRQQGYANDALSEGINSTRGVLAELSIVLLSKFNKEILFRILEKLSKDKTISVRAALVYSLPYALSSLGWDKCFELFENAFDDNAEEYVDLISIFLQYCPKDKFASLKDILSKMKDKMKSKLGEAYAVITTIYYFRGLCAEKEVMEVLTDEELIEKGKEKSFKLLANQIRYKENVEKCLKIIDKLLEKESIIKDELNILFMEARPEDFNKINPIIRKVLDKPEIRGRTIYYILEYLEKSLLIDSVEVFNLLENIILLESKKLDSPKGYLPASHSKAPLNIINTILECYPEEENRALEALDKLIKLKWSGIDEYLYTIDRL